MIFINSVQDMDDKSYSWPAGTLYLNNEHEQLKQCNKHVNMSRHAVNSRIHSLQLHPWTVSFVWNINIASAFFHQTFYLDMLINLLLNLNMVHVMASLNLHHQHLSAFLWIFQPIHKLYSCYTITTILNCNTSINFTPSDIKLDHTSMEATYGAAMLTVSQYYY